MKPQCVDPVCTYLIEPGWDFCPACGTDNRPPQERHAIAPHRHGWLGGQGWCVLCGEPADEPYRFSRKWRLRAAGACLAGGGASLLALGFIRLGIALPATQLGEWVNSWYARKVVHRSGRRYSRTYYTALLGDDLSIVFVVAAGILLFVGTWMALKIPAPENVD